MNMNYINYTRADVRYFFFLKGLQCRRGGVAVNIIPMPDNDSDALREFTIIKHTRKYFIVFFFFSIRRLEQNTHGTLRGYRRTDAKID